jgi:choline dehydrogenase-like flavoprotein
MARSTSSSDRKVVALTSAERRFRALLRAFALIFALAGVGYALGPLVGPFRDAFRELPFVSNSAVKVSVLGLCCLYASGDVRRRMGLAAIVIAGHLVSVSAMVGVLAFGETGRAMHFGSLGSTPVRDVLWAALALDGAITLALIYFFLAARRSRSAPARTPTTPRDELTGAERRMRILAFVVAGVFVAAAAGYELGALLGSTDDFFVALPFVTNSVVKVATFAMLCLYVAHDIRRNLSAWGVVVAGHVISPAVGLLYLLCLNTHYTRPFAGHHLLMRDVMWGAVGLDGALAVIVLVPAYLAAWKARFGLQFFRPVQYRGLLAAAEVVIDGGAAGAGGAVPPSDVAASVERYVSKMTAHRVRLYRWAMLGLQVHPLLFLKPPLSELAPDLRRDHLITCFEKVRPTHNWVRNLPQVCVRMAQQLCYAAYYNDPRAWEEIGYQPFSKRPRYDPSLRASQPHPLHVQTPRDLSDEPLDSEICIVGSGAGGAILAYELAKLGHEVLILERGEYVEPRYFTEDEVEMVSRLYADGVMQQTEDFRFTVLQGSCVGGSTTVNNAVCFNPPEDVLARWNDPDLHDAGLNLGELVRCVGDIREFIGVRSQRDAPLNPSGSKYVEGAAALGLAPLLKVEPVDANIKDCLGCGYCNIGCAYGRKLSMLDTTLPRAQREFPDRVRIIAECEVERIRAASGQPAHAVDLRARLSDGRLVTVRAQKFVVSAGAVASSYLLMRSGLGRDLPVGEHLCFNMGAPLTAEFDEAMDAFDGLQISHYGLPRALDGFAFETWWNPPVAQAENMPGWFGDHFANMRRYERLMAVGVLVGTAGNAKVYKSPLGGPGIRYVPEQRDLATLARGLKLLAEILFAAGAKRVMLNTWDKPGAEFTSKAQLARLEDVVLRPAWMTLGTGHPQGGNALSKRRTRGVVGPDFRVHGYDNLYVCDASVFPSSLTVNPQLTVMSLARYAAPRISGTPHRPQAEPATTLAASS